MTLNAAGRSPRHGPAHSRRARPRLRDSAPPLPPSASVGTAATTTLRPSLPSRAPAPLLLPFLHPSS